MLEWLNVDLHIHSPGSNIFKKNDWKGKINEEYIEELINFTKKTDIFSITDHNIINFDLYDKLLDIQNIKDKILPGIEIDVLDSNITDNKFHLLMIFDVSDYEKLKKFIETLHEGKQVDPATTWTFEAIYSSLFTSKIKSFFVIPHYNNKATGLAVKDIEEMHTPLAVFSAFEDGNNPNNISTSISKYLKDDAKNFPTVAFSDWHGEEEHKKSSTFFLGSSKHIYESIRLAVSDPRMRISFMVEENNTSEFIRPIKKPKKYVKNFTLNDTTYELSPYQNTIIGGFGSGKSLLSTLILKGKEETKESSKYSKIINKINNFSMDLNDGITIDSLKDARINCLSFEQNSQIYSSNIITKEIANQLEDQLKIKFPNEKKILNFDGKFLINEYIERIIPKETPKINYGLISDCEFYNLCKDSISILQKNEMISAIEETFLTADNSLNVLESRYFERKNLLSAEEKEKFDDSRKNIIETIKLNIERSNLINSSFLEIDDILTHYLNETSSLSNGSAGQINIIVTTISSLENFSMNLAKLKEKCRNIDNTFSKRKIKEILENESFVEHTQAQEIKFITKYNVEIDQVADIYDETLRQKYWKEENSSLFESILNSIEKKDYNLIKKKKITEIDSIIEKNHKKLEKQLNENVVFDILCNDGNYLTNKSAGGKALEIMNLMLSSVNDVNDEICNILVIDQPEDNMDNKHIFDEFVENIRNLKFNAKSIQLIFISHNANIAISADSENIIIASGGVNKDGFNFEYTSGVLEDMEFREKVCLILEGGKEALLRRGLKYGVDFNRKETND